MTAAAVCGGRACVCLGSLAASLGAVAGRLRRNRARDARVRVTAFARGRRRADRFRADDQRRDRRMRRSRRKRQVESKVVEPRERHDRDAGMQPGRLFLHAPSVRRSAPARSPSCSPCPTTTPAAGMATDQASMAEFDAGTGVLTTLRKSAGHGGCGSEGALSVGRPHFALQEMHWQDCARPELKGPPFPTIWPAQQAQPLTPRGATPAP